MLIGYDRGTVAYYVRGRGRSPEKCGVSLTPSPPRQKKFAGVHLSFSSVDDPLVFARYLYVHVL